jgi:hypothetical protein
MPASGNQWRPTSRIARTAATDWRHCAACCKRRQLCPGRSLRRATFGVRFKRTSRTKRTPRSRRTFPAPARWVRFRRPRRRFRRLRAPQRHRILSFSGSRRSPSQRLWSFWRPSPNASSATVDTVGWLRTWRARLGWTQSRSYERRGSARANGWKLTTRPAPRCRSAASAKSRSTRTHACGSSVWPRRSIGSNSRGAV